MRGEHRADFITGLVLIALGTAAIVGGLTMDRLENRGIHPASIPGLVPTALGVALTVAAAALLLRALARMRRGAAGAEAEPLSWRALWLALLLTIGYAVGLVGRIPYEVATALFGFAFIALFEWEPGAPPRRRLIRLATALLQAVLVAVVVALVFERLFLVRLP